MRWGRWGLEVWEKNIWKICEYVIFEAIQSKILVTIFCFVSVCGLLTRLVVSSLSA